MRTNEIYVFQGSKHLAVIRPIQSINPWFSVRTSAHAAINPDPRHFTSGQGMSKKVGQYRHCRQTTGLRATAQAVPLTPIHTYPELSVCRRDLAKRESVKPFGLVFFEKNLPKTVVSVAISMDQKAPL
jgi:hypothetical protein